MSGDAKKDDKKEGKSFLAKLVAISLSVLAVLLFFVVNQITIPETFNQGAQLTSNSGAALHNLARGTDKFASGASDWIGTLLKIAIGSIILFLIGREAMKMLRGGGHDDHPAPDNKKADAKPADAAKH